MYRNIVETSFGENIKNKSLQGMKKLNMRIVNFLIAAFTIGLNSCNANSQKFQMKTAEELMKNLSSIKDLNLKHNESFSYTEPHIPHVNQEEKYITGSGWEKVINSKDYPYSANGLLEFTWNKIGYYGTGTLIAPRIVLTAAHNLVDDRYTKKVLDTETGVEVVKTFPLPTPNKVLSGL